MTSCTCRIRYSNNRDMPDTIEFCPLHAAAEKLLKALQGTLTGVLTGGARCTCAVCETARAAVALATSTKPPAPAEENDE